jgi:hypothetical protein
MTRSVAAELIRSGHLVRGLRVAPLVVGAVSVGVVPALPHAGVGISPVTVLRVVGLILVLGGAFAFDDPAARTLQAIPYPLARRLWLRAGCAAAVVVPLWSVVLLLPSVSGGSMVSRWSLALGLTVEVLAELAVVWATAAWGRRRGVDEPGIAAAPVLLCLVLIGAMNPRARLFVGPGPEWLAAHLRWTAVLVCAAALLALAMRDPGRPNAVLRRRIGAGPRRG